LLFEGLVISIFSNSGVPEVEDGPEAVKPSSSCVGYTSRLAWVRGRLAIDATTEQRRKYDVASTRGLDISCLFKLALCMNIRISCG
jgi:hypothetical protein